MDTPPTPEPEIPTDAPMADALMCVVSVPIGRLIPYSRNPRKNTAAIAKVAASLREFGWRQPIVVDDAYTVIAGHTRLEAARTLGMSEVPVHVATGLSANQIKAYRLADNRVGSEAEWDNGLLTLEACGRSAALIELSPVYCDVIVKRWEDATGMQAVRP